MASDTPQRFVVALKRGQPQALAVTVQDEIARIPGITLIGSSTTRSQIDATPAAIEELRSRVGEFAHIEGESPRFP